MTQHFVQGHPRARGLVTRGEEVPRAGRTRALHCSACRGMFQPRVLSLLLLLLCCQVRTG